MSLPKLKPTKEVIDFEVKKYGKREPDETFAPEPRELVVTSKPGALSPKVKQAGADHPDGKWIKDFRLKAEKHLYVFVKSVLGRLYLTASLHLPLCKFLQDISISTRKMALIPRECGKTSIVAHGLPLHIVIQPRDHNIYFPGEHGYNQRIVIASKAARLATDSLRVIQSHSESNPLMKALWPDRFWESRKHARSNSKAWSTNELILPRDQSKEWPDPTFRAVGVGAAITGSHPSVLIKDDLINEEDHSSVVVMQTAIQWHTVSHALVNRPGALEFVIGTRWHIHDLYNHIMRNEASFKCLVRSLIEYDDDGQEFCIYPEFNVTYPDGSVLRHGFSPEKVLQLKQEFGAMMFSLQYMNDARDPSLVDFDEKQLRSYEFKDGMLEFADDQRDIHWADLQKAAKANTKPAKSPAQQKYFSSRDERRNAAFGGRPAPLENLRKKLENL